MYQPSYFFASLLVTLSAVILPVLALMAFGAAAIVIMESLVVPWHIVATCVVLAMDNLGCTIAIFWKSNSAALRGLRSCCLVYLGLMFVGALVWSLPHIGDLLSDPPPSLVVAPPVAIALAGMYIARHYASLLPGHCWNCGYDLRGSDSPRCPECGASRETPP